MNRLLVAVAVLLLASVQSACAPSLKSYADPSFRKATPAQVRPLSPPLPTRVEVEFQRQGKHRPDADLRLRGFVETAMRETKVLAPDQLSPAIFKVVVNNVGDRGEGREAGFITGISLGFSGAMVTDEYQFNISYSAPGTEAKQVYFRHAMRTAVGGIELPEGVEALKPADAYGHIVEDAVYAALQQLQTDQVIGQ